MKTQLTKSNNQLVRRNERWYYKVYSQDVCIRLVRNGVESKIKLNNL